MSVGYTGLLSSVTTELTSHEKNSRKTFEKNTILIAKWALIKKKLASRDLVEGLVIRFFRMFSICIN